MRDDHHATSRSIGTSNSARRLSQPLRNTRCAGVALDQRVVEVAPLLDQRGQQPVAHRALGLAGDPARQRSAGAVDRERPEPGVVAHLLDEADRPARPVIDRGVEQERLDAAGQEVEPGLAVVLAPIDLGGGAALEPAHVLGAGRAPEVAGERRLGDAELGRPAAILRVVDVATLAPDHVVDHLLDRSRHGYARVV